MRASLLLANLSLDVVTQTSQRALSGTADSRRTLGNSSTHHPAVASGQRRAQWTILEAKPFTLRYVPL